MRLSLKQKERPINVGPYNQEEDTRRLPDMPQTAQVIRLSRNSRTALDGAELNDDGSRYDEDADIEAGFDWDRYPRKYKKLMVGALAASIAIYALLGTKSTFGEGASYRVHQIEKILGFEHNK